MSIFARLKDCLDKAKISYEVYNHRKTFTAQETAQSLHDSGKRMAKVVILRTDGPFLMAVLPADRLLDLRKATAALGARNLRIATEYEFARLFPGCELGAMPPFGNLFGLPVYVDKLLDRQKGIFFNAGNHRQTVALAYADFKKLVQPVVADLTERRYREAA